jgi:hypothetical protein
VGGLWLPASAWCVFKAGPSRLLSAASPPHLLAFFSLPAGGCPHSVPGPFPYSAAYRLLHWLHCFIASSSYCTSCMAYYGYATSQHLRVSRVLKRRCRHGTHTSCSAFRAGNIPSACSSNDSVASRLLTCRLATIPATDSRPGQGSESRGAVVIGFIVVLLRIVTVPHGLPRAALHAGGRFRRRDALIAARANVEARLSLRANRQWLLPSQRRG